MSYLVCAAHPTDSQDLSQRNVVNVSSSNDNRIDIVKLVLAESARPMDGSSVDPRSGYGMLDAGGL